MFRVYRVVQSRPRERLFRSLTETSDDAAGVPLQKPVAEVKGLFTKLLTKPSPSPQGGVEIEDEFAKVFGRESSEKGLHHSEDAESVSTSSTRKHTAEKAEEKLVASPFANKPTLERKTTSSTEGIRSDLIGWWVGADGNDAIESPTLLPAFAVDVAAKPTALSHITGKSSSREMYFA